MAVPLILLNSCTLRQASYAKPRLEESVKELCRKEYNLEVESRLVGKTLYVSCVLDGLVGHDLGLQTETLDKLEGAMLSTTRVALSTDADLNFLMLKARDSRLGVTVSLLRYLPDIKSLIFMRISRSDFEERLVMETDATPKPDDPSFWQDIPMTQFLSRLVASRLQRQFSSNPLVSAFLRIRQVKGAFKENVLTLRLDDFDDEPNPNVLIQQIVRSAVEKTVVDVIHKYGSADIVKRVVVLDGGGRTTLDITTKDLEQKAKSENTKAAA